MTATCDVRILKKSHACANTAEKLSRSRTNLNSISTCTPEPNLTHARNVVVLSQALRRAIATALTLIAWPEKTARPKWCERIKLTVKRCLIYRQNELPLWKVNVRESFSGKKMIQARNHDLPKGVQWIKDIGRSVPLSLCEFVSGEENDWTVERFVFSLYKSNTHSCSQ